MGKIWGPRCGSGADLGWTEKLTKWGVSDNELAISMLEKWGDQDTPMAMFLGCRAPHCPWKKAGFSIWFEPSDNPDIAAQNPLIVTELDALFSPSWT